MSSTGPGLPTLAVVRNWLAPRSRFVGPFLLAGLLGGAGLLRLRSAVGTAARLSREQGEIASRVRILEERVQEAGRPEADRDEEPGSPGLGGTPAEIAHWLSEAVAAARQLGWVLKSQMGEIVVRPVGGTDLRQVPLLWILTPAGSPGDPPAFLRLLRLGEWILTTPGSPEVLSLTVGSGPSGTAECRLELELRFITPPP